MSHTKHPLVVDRKHVHGDARYVTTTVNGVPLDIAKLPYNAGIPENEVDANAKRLADCFNACAGLPQEALDAGWTAKRATEAAMGLEIQRNAFIGVMNQLFAAAETDSEIKGYANSEVAKIICEVKKEMGAASAVH